MAGQGRRRQKIDEYESMDVNMDKLLLGPDGDRPGAGEGEFRCGVAVLFRR